MLSQFFSSLKSRLRVIAFLEGVSFLILLLIAMPMKYVYDDPFLVQQVGKIHGALFVWYIILIVQSKFALKWSWLNFIMAGFASLIPGGTFYADYKLFSK